MKKLLSTLTLSVLCAALAPAVAGASVTIGSNLADPADGEFSCGYTCTEVPIALDAPAVAPGGISSPINGVLVGWKIKVGKSTAPARVRIVRRVDPATNAFSGVFTGPTVTPAAKSESAYATRVPISAGDFIALDTDDVVSSFHPLSGANGIYAIFGELGSGPLADGDPGRSPKGTNSPYEVMIQGTVEPDADGDVFGDETQDMCPGVPGTFAGCPSVPVDPTPSNPPPLDPGPVDPGDLGGGGHVTSPAAPHTTLQALRVNSGKGTAVLRFAATGGAGRAHFECKLDAGRFRRCHAPRVYRHLRPGRHVVRVRAVDEAGQIDATPEIRRFRVSPRAGKR